ncbi:asparagine synthase (glutamine-hydrolyzing) [Miniphocaeibacter halophilus]|uniref:Asparagine synthase (Glutamine-hydrolyzing) n=1 Tax=Miniphocaeibacter halophilus TaxID=2931922 RepID=A0AC61MS25_9FIRM|nr:asparagine synthase (glutamine-hydrolyzing) [Miniphocaeibacter halophilus]QQK08367.1 asparagine synthase (glutamine-hydrolyzing) [Miniphocaeibacter halophilus]
MCGFVGVFNPNKIDENYKPILKEMADEIIHRGPNSDGYFFDNSVAFGFRRLSMVDLSSCGDQPFYTEDKTKVMVFNGEIYNYKEIREELIKDGYEFISNTDSEVLLKAYDKWGEKVLNKLRGMFVFVVWDMKNQELFMARDFFGIKPLYYTMNTKDGSLLFGSEIKAFLKNPNFIKEFNKDALKPYLTFQYSALEETFFKGVYKLKQGHYMKIKNGKMDITRYWKPEFKPTNKSLDEYVEDIRKVMEETVDLYKETDVKWGSFLSGGIDSSYIACLSKPEKTFSVGFKDYEGDYNETHLAKELSDIIGAKHHVKLIGAEDCIGNLPKIQYLMDEPHSNLSAIPLYFLSQMAGEHVTAVLSGEGADELFGGYFPYGETENLKKYKKLPFGLRRFLKNITKNMKRTRLTKLFDRGGSYLHEEFIGEAKIYEPEHADKLLKPEYRKGRNPYDIAKEFYSTIPNESELTKKQLMDMEYWMPGDILLKGDKMSSAHSIEVRTPFLDPKVMEVAATIPEEFRVNGDKFKYALRKASEKSLPDEWANRKKVGFPVPIRYWLREEKYYNIFKEEFTSDIAKKFFNTDELVKLLDEHYEKKALNQRLLWTPYVFLIWYKEYFVKR